METIKRVMLLILFVLFSAACVSAATVTVCSSGCNFTAIQAAIDAASPGDTVSASAGTYFESQVTIGKQLTLIGAGMPTIDGGTALLSTDGLVRITAAADVTFSGFTIKHAGGSATTDNGDNLINVGIYASSSNPAAAYLISGNKIYGTNNPSDEQDYGFYANGGLGKIIFTNNTVLETSGNQVLIERYPGETEISANKLNAGCYGIDPIFYMTYGSTDISSLQEISGNEIDMGTGSGSDPATGISFMSSYSGSGPIGDGKYSNILIQDNIITGLKSKRRGISLYNDANESGHAGEISNAVIKNNTIIGNQLAPSFGIRLAGYVTGSVITSNFINGTDQCFLGINGRNDNGQYAVGTNLSGNYFIRCGVQWNGPPSLHARYNWWQYSSGPYHLTLNPSGQGGPVSDNVLFSPWLIQDAQCISNTFPAAMAQGQSRNVTLTLKNTGALSWIPTGLYRLGSQGPQDNTVWSLSRANLTSTVQPGQQHSFTFQITSPLAPGNYSTTWQMLQEGVEWFGSKCPMDISVVNAPPPVITIGLRVPDPVWNDTSELLNATVNSSLLDSVWLVSNFSGTSQKYTLSPTGQFFTFLIDSSYFSVGQSVGYEFFANDTLGNLASSGPRSFLVYGTLLLVAPPSGCNGWYNTNPTFTLIPVPANLTVHYRFDGLSEQLYSVPFVVPTPQILPVGGHQILHFWSDASGSTESHSSYDFKIDTSAPQIQALNPLPGVYNNKLSQLIGGLVEDIYFDDSGVDLSTVQLRLNGALQPFSSSPTLNGFNISQNASTPNGLDLLRIDARDYACNAVTRSWNFTVDSTGIPVAIFYSPIQGFLYNKTMILERFELGGSAKIEQKISDGWLALCKNCSYYNQTRSFQDGLNQLVIKTTDPAGNEILIGRNFTVETKKPRIVKTWPTGYTNGSFAVQLSEENLVNVTLFYLNGSSGLYQRYPVPGCTSGIARWCNTTIDLSPYNGQYISYYFNLTDPRFSTASTVQKVKADTIRPAITILPVAGVVPAKLNLVINVTEPVTLTAAWDNATLTSFCSSCSLFKKTYYLTTGIHTLHVRAVDKASNANIASATFNII